MAAFELALAQGADRLELDVHATRDGHIVVLHDDTLERTTDAAGPVRHRTLAELETVDAGARFVDREGHSWAGRGVGIPTFEEVVAATTDVALNVEIKQAGSEVVEAVLDVLDRHGARERTLLAAEDHDILAAIRNAAPEQITGASHVEVFAFYQALIAGTLEDLHLPGTALQVPPMHEDIEVVTPAFVEAAHALGMEVHVWTINEADEMERLLALEVDGIMTDDPALGSRVFQRLGLRASR